ncbi:pseudaminic acid cytidylyltransferase [Alteromonas sp. C1M14]|uniref:pseudaminic acid cytidylyltransferase n=1 Tax=Alteromonas sp. C1M14 TaxID=2841567 RepID=UPI001C0851C7|nr:pseudaminic acid cytidylyltransferase [Alteromonas sp. C1M14]MBU2977941.1 pseudaminic acid cytidylyltransferase [Alteromonas sp. C1M14]
MNIAVIPARGGSKRIPNKNIRLFAGKPLIAYSIEAAKNSQLFDDIVVSTDSDDIARVAKEYGASCVIERPATLAGDFTGTFPVVQHGIHQYQRLNGPVNYVCCIYATAPFLQADKLQEGYGRLLDEPDMHFAFSVTTFPFPIQRAITLKGKGVCAIQPEQMGKRSQDLVECYHDAGQFYWGTTNAWLTGKPTFAPTSIPVILPRYLVQDIDTPEDWQRAELMYRAYVSMDK